MTREKALEILETNPYDEYQMQRDKAYIARKLRIIIEEFDEIIAHPNKTPSDYKNSMLRIQIAVGIARIFGLESRNIR